MNDEDQLRIYPVWSNFIYFIAGLYSLILGFQLPIVIDKSFLFLTFGLLLIFTGSFSIVYHMNTPSWTNNPKYINDEEFHKWLKVDSGFAITTVVFAIFMLLFRISMFHPIYRKYKYTFIQYIFCYPLFRDPNFWLSLLFIILSVTFYYLAHGYNLQATTECKNKRKCFNTNIDSYDILHSNWHIFTSIAGLFWITTINHSYKWK